MVLQENLKLKLTKTIRKFIILIVNDEIDLGLRLITLYRSFEDLSAILLKVFALGLDVHEDYFLKLAKRHFSILSSHNYPPLNKNPKKGLLKVLEIFMQKLGSSIFGKDLN